MAVLSKASRWAASACAATVLLARGGMSYVTGGVQPQQLRGRAGPQAVVADCASETGNTVEPVAVAGLGAAPLLFGGAAMLAVGSSAARRQRGQRSSNRGRPQATVVACRAAAASAPGGGYCEAAEKCERRRTRTVNIGGVKIGSDHPIALQTMANTLTHEVEATVAQIKKCADMGIDIVRVTVQGMREAKACEHIKKRLLEDGYTTPIVADIHFTPKVALVAAEFCDKIRVNPGNFVDGRKSFNTIDKLTDEDIKDAQADIEREFAPLVLKLKEKGKALRIGVNHGSLAERILFQYGDSPEGMVASAMEFGEICRKYDYHNFVFSMKSSNPKVMVEAYRQLSREMYARGWDYPIHLGVTEAGGGADGRIKSGIGIGALLIDGIGDTIRVSLTEDPEFEAAPCRALRQVAEASIGKGVAPFDEPNGRRNGPVARRECSFPLDVPLNSDGSVFATISAKELASLDIAALCQRLSLRLRKDGDVQKDWKSVDVVVVNGPITDRAAAHIKTLLQVPLGVLCTSADNIPDGCTVACEASAINAPLPERVGGYAVVFNGDESAEVIQKALHAAKPRMVLLRPDGQDGVTFLGRRFFANLISSAEGKATPLMLWFRYPKVEGMAEDDVVIKASADFGSLFIDSIGEGILWEADLMTPEELREASFNLLQASRMRISKTEFISCPSCGRTLFNLQDTTARIQARTGHLPGVRIAVMGCIVNGPGEMADADFGYVGSGVGKVDLYVKYDCVKRAVPTEEAVDALVELIKEHGRWTDPADADEVDSEVGAVAVM